MTSSAFWDKLARKYASRPVSDPSAYEAKLERVAKDLKATDNVLEIGAGTGSTALRLAPNVAHMTATDFSSEMMVIAEEKRTKADTDNVRFVQADAADKIDGGPFDVIMAFSLLHLVDDVPAVLASARDQLKEGGLFISKTACLKDRTMLKIVIAIMRFFGQAPKVGMLSESDLINELRAAGFDTEPAVYFDAKKMNPYIVARRK